jgi:hypothetical protein
LLKLLWVLFITGFSWLQIIGLALYIFFWPLVLFYLRRHGSAAKASYEQAREKDRNSAFLPDRPVWTYTLMSCLIIWFVLYGDSSLRPPFLAAIGLTGLLFATRVYHALAYTAQDTPSGKGWIDRYTESVIAQFNEGSTSLLEKKALDLKSLSAYLRAWNLS